MFEATLLNFIANRWKPFSIVFSFFIVGFLDAKAYLLYQAGGMRAMSVYLLIAVNAVILVYLGWLCARPSFCIQPRSKAVAYALAAAMLGVVLAIIEGH